MGDVTGGGLRVKADHHKSNRMRESRHDRRVMAKIKGDVVDGRRASGRRGR